MMRSQPLLRLPASDDENNILVTEFTVTPIQFTSLQDVKGVLQKLVSLGVATFAEASQNLSDDIDIAKVAHELLLGSDGKTYFRSDICQLSIEMRERFPIYFIKQDVEEISYHFGDLSISFTSEPKLFIIKASEITPTQNNCRVNHWLALALSELDLETQNFRSEFKFPTLTDSFDDAVAFINSAFEDLIWVLCQNLMRPDNISEHDADILKKCEAFFSFKESQLQDFATHLAQIQKMSLILSNLNEQNLPPQELNKKIASELANETMHQKNKLWDEKKNHPIFVHEKKFNLAMNGIFLGWMFSIVATPLYLGAAGIRAYMLYHRVSETANFHKEAANIPELIETFRSQMPSINYLSSVIPTTCEQLAFKIKAIHHKLCGTVAVEDITPDATPSSYLQMYKNHFQPKPEIKSEEYIAYSVMPPQEAEPEEGIEMKAFHLSSVTIEDITEEVKPILENDSDYDSPCTP